MAYSRPSGALEINPSASLMTNAIIWAPGTATGGSMTTFGRAALTVEIHGNAGSFTNGTDYAKYNGGAGDAFGDNYQLTAWSDGGSAAEFTRVFAFFVPATLSAGMKVWISQSEDTGGGYIVNACMLGITTDGYVYVNKANVAEAMGVSGRINFNAVNVIALTRYADKTVAMSINGTAVVTGSAQDYTFGRDGFGRDDFRGTVVAPLQMHFYAQNDASVSSANLISLSSNPTQMIRAVGTAPAATIPNAPTSVVATLSGTTALVTCTPGADGGSAITGYSLLCSDGKTATGVSLPLTVTGLSPGVAVTFTMKAINVVGPSLASAASNSVTPSAADTAKPTLSSATIENTGAPGIVLVFNENIGKTNMPPASSFIIDSRTVTGVLNLSAQNSFKVLTAETFNGGEVVKISYTLPVTNPIADISGNTANSFSNVTATNNLPFKPTLPGYDLKIIGADAAYDFQNVAQFKSYLQSLDCTALDKPVMVWSDIDLNLSGVGNVGPQNSNDTKYVTLRPMPSKRYDVIDPNLYDITTSSPGIKLIVNSETSFRIGMDISGFNTLIAAGASSPYQVVAFRRDGWGQGGSYFKFHHNRVLSDSNSCPFGSGEYGGRCDFEDNLFKLGAGSTYTGDFIRASSGGNSKRNTFARNANNVGPALQGFSLARDNNFSKCGDNPGGNATGDHNYSDTVYNGTATGTNYYPGQFFDSSTNLRPAAGSPMIGGGSNEAVSKNDAAGKNRGVAADTGSYQRTPAVALPTAAVATQDVDGMSFIADFTTTDTPVSGLITLSPDASDPQGASSVGPLAITIGTNTAHVEVDDVPAGHYNWTATFTNAGGTTSASGTLPFRINGLGNLVYDGGGVAAGGGGTTPVLLAPTVAIQTTNAEIMDGKTASFGGTVNLQGDLTGSLQLFIDQIVPSGTAQGPFAIPVNNGAWTVQRTAAVGKVRYRVQANANSQTATAQTGEITTVSMINSVRLPV